MDTNIRLYITKSQRENYFNWILCLSRFSHYI